MTIGLQFTLYCSFVYILYPFYYHLNFKIIFEFLQFLEVFKTQVTIKSVHIKSLEIRNWNWKNHWHWTVESKSSKFRVLNEIANTEICERATGYNIVYNGRAFASEASGPQKTEKLKNVGNFKFSGYGLHGFTGCLPLAWGVSIDKEYWHLCTYRSIGLLNIWGPKP